jgi:CRISPR/Cas system-associated exonuclease Cas4 (RecB family)
MPGERRTNISASEIGEYVYCARAWWLRRVEGFVPDGRERREQGTNLHQRHGQAVATSGVLIWVGVALLIVAALLLVLAR